MKINTIILAGILLPLPSLADNPFDDLKSSEVSYFDLGVFKIRTQLKIPDNRDYRNVRNEEIRAYSNGNGITVKHHLTTTKNYGFKHIGELMEECSNKIESLKIRFGFVDGEFKHHIVGIGQYFYPESFWDDKAKREVRSLSEKLSKNVLIESLVCTSDFKKPGNFQCVECSSPLTSTKVSFDQ